MRIVASSISAAGISRGRKTTKGFSGHSIRRQSLPREENPARNPTEDLQKIKIGIGGAEAQSMPKLFIKVVSDIVHRPRGRLFSKRQAVRNDL